MPGYYVSATFMPYYFSPGSMSAEFQESLDEARMRGVSVPATMLGSLMLVSTPSQRLEDYVVYIRAQNWLSPWDDIAAECLGPICETSRLFPIPFPARCDLWWSQRDAAILSQELAGFYGVPCKAHYYFANYLGSVDCYVQYGPQFRDGIEYDHYSVSDISEPSAFNVARAYEFKDKVVREEWRRAYRV